MAGAAPGSLVTAGVLLVGALGLPGTFEALGLAQLALAGALGLAALRAGRAAVAA